VRARHRFAAPLRRSSRDSKAGTSSSPPGGEGRGRGPGTAALRLAGLFALIATASLALTVSSASALTTRKLESQIVGTCPSAGPCSPSEVIKFARPFGLTTDSSGDLWVSDTGAHSVDKFSPAGVFEAQNEGTGSWGESSFIEGISFSAAADEVFVSDSNHDDLWGLDPATAAYSGKDLRPLGGSECCFLKVAADNSGGATGGDLYVSTGTGVVRIKAADGSADEFTAGPAAGTNELTGPFTSAGAVAVGPGGNLFVAGSEAVYEFEPSGELLREFTEAEGASLTAVSAIAVDPTSGNLLVAEQAERVALFEFSPTGAFERRISKAEGAIFAGLRGLAVAPNGTVYLAEAPGEAEKVVDVFSPLIVLPDVTTQPATGTTTTTATLNGEVDPAGVLLSECFFEYGETTTYGHTVLCEESNATIGSGTSPVPVEAQIEGLKPGATYHYRLVAANANGANEEGNDETVFTGATIDSASASAVSSTAATLETEINPHGVATTYHFEYDSAPYAEGGPAHGTAVPFPAGGLGSGEAPVFRSVHVQGVAPLTTYHYRVVAENALGTVLGPDRTFITQGAAPSLLPDGRGWEQVSPLDKQGIPLESIAREGGLIQAAAGGGAITYFAKGPIISGPAGNRSAVNSQDLSTRTAAGWSTQDISTPHQAVTGLIAGNPSEYKLFSSELSLSAVEPFGATPLSAEARERTPYLRQADGTYSPLVVGCPELPQPCPQAIAEHANVPPGAAFGGIENGLESFALGLGFVTATPDLSHILLSSVEVSLVEGFDTFGEPSIYEWTAGNLTPVSILPDGSPAGGAHVGSAIGGQVNHQLRNAISADGSRVFFQAGARRLYMRDVSRGETLWVNAPESGLEESGNGANFQYASSDGNRVFFTDEGRLTADSTAAPGHPDLYLCQVIGAVSGEVGCDLSDITAKSIRPTETADVQGAVLGAAEDGSDVYFVADGDLAPGAVSGDCVFSIQAGGTGECNLYRYDTESETTTLVSVVSGEDFADWQADGEGNLGGVTARVSANGRYLAFMSRRSLTGYDNRDAKTGVRDQEVYLYDAGSDGGAGKLVCASCNPNGARPRGVFDPPTFPGLLVDRARNWGGQTLAANIPGWTNVDNSHALYQSRYLSDSGRLFFNAADALVPQDTNGVMDVYEYESPQGEGMPASDDCSTSAPTYSPSSGGCVSLISSGTSAEESAFLDASESGDDIFFLTAAKLAPTDTDNALDIYDARVGGSSAAPAKPVECSGDACQQPAVPPNDATPGSLTFNGAGNVLECPKGKVKKNGKCVKKRAAKKKKHHKKNKDKKSNKNSKQQKNAKKHRRAVGHKGGGHR
jgi:hypothetical protein